MLDVKKFADGEAGYSEFPPAAIISPTPTSPTYKTGTWRTEKPVIDQSKCVKCLLCWVFCPDMSVKRLDDDSVEIDYEYCKGCGICSEVCPTKAIEMVEEV